MLESVVKAVLGFLHGLYKAWVDSERLQQLEREKEARAAMSAAEAEKEAAEAAINAVEVKTNEEGDSVEDALSDLDNF